jgi:hypothetical protein
MNPCQLRSIPLLRLPALSPLGERVARPGVFFSRGGPGEGVVGLPQAASALSSRVSGALLLAHGASRGDGVDPPGRTQPRQGRRLNKHGSVANAPAD